MKTSRVTKEKPYPDFPLFWHQSGNWVKKIKGKLYWFGTDPDAALKKYLDEKDDLQAGRKPRTKSDELTVMNLANRFLTSKKVLLAAGELADRTWRDYFDACELLLHEFGKNRSVIDLQPDDFEKLRGKISKTCGPVALGNRIQHIRTIFKYGFDDGLLEIPIRFGQAFRKPSRKTIRKARHESGGKMIEAGDMRKILDSAGQPLKAMILLAINGGLGSADLANLPKKALDLNGGWLNYPRPKTGIDRRIPLWPETIKALREAMKKMPKAKDAADTDLVFITKYGKRWVRFNKVELGESIDVTRDRAKVRGVAIDSIGLEFNKVLTDLGMKGDGKRKGLGFYGIRHTFRTAADASKDQPAIDHIMGHAKEDMASLYRERIDDDRLQAVVDVVHAWLWPPEKKKATKDEGEQLDLSRGSSSEQDSEATKERN